MLKLENVKEGQNKTHWINIGELKAGDNISCHITLVNTGSRTAYCKALPFHGIKPRSLYTSLVALKVVILFQPNHKK